MLLAFKESRFTASYFVILVNSALTLQDNELFEWLDVKFCSVLSNIIAYLASSLEPHAPPIVWRFAEINHYVGLR